MLLTLEQIQAITVGAVSVTKDTAGFHFSRFTPTQVEAFRSHGTKVYPRVFNSTGICLSFHTDARNLLVIPTKGNQYEVMVDDNPLYYYRGDDNSFRMALTLPEGDKHVKILLPHHSEAVLMNIHIDNGAYIRPHTYDRKFLFLGDSIVEGLLSERDSHCFTSIVANFFNAEAMNWGVGGSYMDPNTLEDVGFDPDAVIIAYGTNDYNVCASPEDQDTACVEYFKKVNELFPGKKIFYISPIWRADSGIIRNTGTLAECRQRLIQRCQEAGFIHIDGYRMHPHCTDYLRDQYLHPNSQGFFFYGLNLIKALMPHL